MKKKNSHKLGECSNYEISSIKKVKENKFCRYRDLTENSKMTGYNDFLYNKIVIILNTFLKSKKSFWKILGH